MSLLSGELTEGTVFARDYRIVRPLASGGMGAVYVVSQNSTGKERALKLMHPVLAASADARRRFLLEARVGAGIDSEHVVEIHSAGVDEATGAPYLVMELLQGEDLLTRVDRGPLTKDELLEVFEQICHAMGAAHDRGIVHRDLKPENVFLSRARRAGADRVNVKVLDFGIAKLVAEAGSASTGMIGTPLWMAPEQCDRGEVTPAADVWALGLMAYFALVGRPFWRAAEDPHATPAQVLKEVLFAPMPHATARAEEQGLAERLPADVAAVITRALSREKSGRPRDARAFWAELATALGVPTSSPVVSAGSAPSSAKVVSAAALDRTHLAVPARGTVLESPAVIPPASGVSRPQKAFFSLEGLTPGAIAVRASVVVASALALVLVGRGCSIKRSTRGEATAPIVRLDTPAGQTMPLGARPGAQVLPAASVRVAPPPVVRCRLCSGDVVTLGPVPKAQIIGAVEGAFAQMDSECIETRGKRKVRSGAVTLGFEVKEGEPTNRRVLATSSTDGADECLVRALSDVRFPVAPGATEVSYSLSFDPAAPR
jgi:eukaryotic-like serine/threonine-protein kinase